MPGESWRRTVLFDFSPAVVLRKTVVSVPETSARFIRIIVSDPQPPLPALPFKQPEGAGKQPFIIGEVSGRLTGAGGGAARNESINFNGFTISIDAQKNTVFDLGEVNLPLSRLILSTRSESFYRKVEVWTGDSSDDKESHQLASGEVYKIPGMKEPQTTLRLPGEMIRFLKVKLHNLEGDTPLEISSIEGQWAPYYLYFSGEQGRQYTLLFAGNPTRVPNAIPVNPALTRESIYRSKAKEATLGPVSDNPAFSPPPPAVPASNGVGTSGL